MTIIKISKPRYGEKSYLVYVLENYRNLMNGITHGQNCLCCSDLYSLSAKHKGRKGSIKKEAFFIYWLYADINKLWTAKNLREGAPVFKNKCDKILNILDELKENLDIGTYDRHDAENINRILRNYQKSSIIEKTIIDSLRNTSESFSAALKGMKGAPFLLSYSIDEILGFIRAQGTVIKSDIRRRNRRFQKMRKDFFDMIIEYLIEKKSIDARTYSGRTFLSAKRT